ncbi:MAG: hypothetical protein LE180_01865 [Endomicrobium sp.]|uniref:hypothetical protein n=1 Tax=Candidatus Endomicrobiellum pyrsonymphae TaxID=1408203 RepID=UPI00357B5E08|nr:hypothetical protein [Endomicrobium sp.]
MSQSNVIRGKAFWKLDESEKRHLYFVLSEPNMDNIVLVVNATDVLNVPACHDKSCVLDIGEHRAITKKSVVYYRVSKEFRASEILLELSKKELILEVDLSTPTLLKIQNGAKNSKLLPKKLRKYFEKF